MKTLHFDKRGCRAGMLVLLALWVTSARADQEGDFTFSRNGATAVLTGYTGPGGAVVIPDRLGNLPAASIGDGAFYGRTDLTSLTIPDSVTFIGRRAFSRCTGLTGVTIPNSVTSIEWGAFSDCTGLTSVTIPNSVTSTGDYAFSSCTGLTSVTIPTSVTAIGDGAFSGCTGLTSVTIPGSVTDIGRAAFQGCTTLTTVTIPNSVTAIGDKAFYLCPGLTSVTIPTSVTAIGEWAFSYCTGLTSVTIPTSVTAIGEYAFHNCTGLTSVTIPVSVSAIGRWAFSGCTGLTSVYLGDAPGLSLPWGDATVFDGSSFVTVFYRAGAAGWTPTFAGRPTAMWVPRPAFGDWAVATGLTTLHPDASAEGDDPDGDGFANGEEWFAGTDPTQPASRLELELTPRPAELSAADRTPIGAGQHAVYFRSVPDRYYGVERSTGLGGVWELQATKVATTPQTRFVLPQPPDHGFYRVLALP